MPGYIAGFILLALFSLLALAGWRGWGSDTRDPDYGIGPVITPPSLRRCPAEAVSWVPRLSDGPATVVTNSESSGRVQSVSGRSPAGLPGPHCFPRVLA